MDASRSPPCDTSNRSATESPDKLAGSRSRGLGCPAVRVEHRQLAERSLDANEGSTQASKIRKSPAIRLASRSPTTAIRIARDPRRAGHFLDAIVMIDQEDSERTNYFRRAEYEARHLLSSRSKRIRPRGFALVDEDGRGDRLTRIDGQWAKVDSLVPMLSGESRIRAPPSVPANAPLAPSR